MPAPFSTPKRKDTREENIGGFLKDIYLTFFMDIFARRPKGEFRYTGSDSPESELNILDVSSSSTEVIEKRPSIVLQRGPISWSRIGLDQLKELDIVTGTRRHVDMISGTMTMHCSAKLGLEAERLASQVFDALKFHRRELQRRGLFDGGQEAQMGSETPPGSIVSGDTDPHTVVVPVYSPFYIQRAWESKPANPTLFKNMEIRLSPISTVHTGKVGGKKVIELDAVAQDVKIPKAQA